MFEKLVNTFNHSRNMCTLTGTVTNDNQDNISAAIIISIQYGTHCELDKTRVLTPLVKKQFSLPNCQDRNRVREKILLQMKMILPIGVARVRKSLYQRVAAVTGGKLPGDPSVGWLSQLDLIVATRRRLIPRVPNTAMKRKRNEIIHRATPTITQIKIKSIQRVTDAPTRREEKELHFFIFYFSNARSVLILVITYNFR